MKYPHSVIKKAIEVYEYFQPMYKHLNGIRIRTKHLRVKKLKYIVDTTIHYSEDNKKEIFLDCEYSKEIIDRMIKEGDKN